MFKALVYLVTTWLEQDFHAEILFLANPQFSVIIYEATSFLPGPVFPLSLLGIIWWLPFPIV